MRNDPGSIGYAVLRSRQQSHSLLGWIRFLVDRYHSWSRRNMHKVMRAGMFMLLALIVVVELLALAASAKVSDLERVHADSNGTWYVNARTMVNPGGDKASFWSTVVPKKDSAYFDVLKMVLEKRGKDARRLEYVQILQEVDCSLWTIHPSNVLFYDKQDRIVHTVNSASSAKLIAEFGQAAGNILSSVCGQQVARLMGE